MLAHVDATFDFAALFPHYETGGAGPLHEEERSLRKLLVELQHLLRAGVQLDDATLAMVMRQWWCGSSKRSRRHIPRRG
jgi:hypothetical protein